MSIKNACKWKRCAVANARWHIHAWTGTTEVKGSLGKKAVLQKDRIGILSWKTFLKLTDWQDSK